MWLDTLTWSAPADMPITQNDGNQSGVPYLLWTADSTFSLFWLTPNPDFTPGENAQVLICRQDFSVATGGIVAATDPVRIEDADPGVGAGGYVADGQMGPDGSYWLMFGEYGGN